ncbi:unnamed protein product [Echinostoma caproni]|uniref:DUF5641 domain-containing protein n=1 Tax=Echinostoma caproni TaxID=27848 RepID=A0A183B585_9TREM|nr:unnamed protein product [Echinostoma caproni]
MDSVASIIRVLAKNTCGLLWSTLKQVLRIGNRRTNLLHLESAEVVYHRGNDLRFSRGIVLDHMGQGVCRTLDLDDDTVHRRHVDKVIYELHPGTNIEDSSEEPGRSERLLNKPAVITENRSFIQAAADVVIAHEL